MCHVTFLRYYSLCVPQSSNFRMRSHQVKNRQCLFLRIFGKCPCPPGKKLGKKYVAYIRGQRDQPLRNIQKISLQLKLMDYPICVRMQNDAKLWSKYSVLAFATIIFRPLYKKLQSII